MNKFKITKKYIKNSYDKIILIGYCNLQYLLKFENPFAYSTRAEGWACDYYNINNVVISTGYAPVGNITIAYDTQQRYEDKAREIVCNYKLSYEEQKEQVNNLLNELIQEVV